MAALEDNQSRIEKMMASRIDLGLSSKSPYLHWLWKHSDECRRHILEKYPRVAAQTVDAQAKEHVNRLQKHDLRLL
jgi:predicted nicotinamide N-methyase